MSPNELAQAVSCTRWPGNDRLMGQVPLDVRYQLIGRLVPAGPVLFQGLHHYPIQIAPDNFAQPVRLHLAVSGNIGQGTAEGA